MQSSQPRPGRSFDPALARLSAIPTGTTQQLETATLRHEHLLYQALLSTIAEGVILSSEDGTVTMCNEKAAEILRLTQEQIYRGEHKRLCENAIQCNGTPFESLKHPIRLAFETGQQQVGHVMGLRHPTGELLWISINTTPLFREGEVRPFEVLGTFTDITSEVEHENHIQSQQRRLAEAQRIARLGSWTWTPSTNRVWWSDAIYELFGVDQQTTEPSYEAFRQLVHPEDRCIADARVEAIEAGSDEFASDLRIIRPDNACLWLHSRARVHRDFQGNITLVEGIDQDITERKQGEDALKASERRLSIALKAANAVAFELDLPRLEVIRHGNDAKDWPVDLPSPFHLDSLRALIHPNDLPCFDQAIRVCLDNGQGSNGDFQCQYRVARQDGKYFYLQSWGMLERGEGGVPLRLSGISIDVTERIREHEESHRTATLLQAVASGTTDAVFVKDLHGNYLFANEATCHITKRPLEEVVGSTDFQLFEEESACLIADIDRAVIEGRSVTTSEETLTVDGTTRTFLATKGPLFDPLGNVIGVVGISRDITKRKETEQALALTQFTVDHVHDAIFWTNAEMQFIYANAAACERLGYSRERLLTMHIWDIDPMIQRERNNQTIAHLRATGSSQFESKHRTCSGVLLDVEVTCSYLNFDGREIVCLFARDVTDRKKTEQNLRLTKFSVDHITDIIFWLTPEGRFVNVNHAACERLGYDRDTLLTLSMVDIDPSISPEGITVCWERIKADRSYIRHSVFIAKDGSTFDVEVTCNYFEYEGRAYACAIARDISRRRRTERLINTQHAVVRTLAEANDLVEAAEQLLVAIGTSSMWHQGEFWIYDNDDLAELRLLRRWVEGESVGFATDEPLPGFAESVLQRVRRTRKTEWLAEVDDTQQIGGSSASAPLRSWVAIPIVFNNQAKGALAFYSRVRRERDAQLVDVLENLSLQIGQFIERKKTEHRVRLFRALLDRANDIIEVSDVDSGRIIDVNLRGCEAHGYTREEYIQLQNCDTISLFENNQNRSNILAQLRERGNLTIESQYRRKDGSMFPVEISTNLIALDREYLVAVVRDITDRKLTEERMRMSQKMEAIGQLAGGIAHDFNNLLTVINCHSQLLLDITHPQDSLREHYAAIQHAGNRAAELTSQLLTFSRRRICDARAIDLNDVIRISVKMLSRVLSEDITLELQLAPELRLVLADSVQIERIVLNLAVNARDAMNDGGQLRLSTLNLDIDEQNSSQFPGLPAGKYVLFEATDTGRGMSDDIRERIFEPFFTTKEIGAGTGLGLAVVHGIVQQYHGQIYVDSRLQEGTTFRILLPAATATKDTIYSDPISARGSFSATILVVDDEEAVQSVVRSVLEPKGFQILTASDGENALQVLKTDRAQKIDVLLTDVIMPNMKGHELAARVKKLYPEIHTIFMSGYPVGVESSAEPMEHLLSKPFTPAQVFNCICEVLAKK